MKADLGQFVVLWASTFGIAYTLSSLHGPFGLCEKFREWVKKKPPESSEIKECRCHVCKFRKWMKRKSKEESVVKCFLCKLYEWSKKQLTEDWFVKGVKCPICLSFWVSFFIVPIIFWSDTSLSHLITGAASSVGIAAAIMSLSPPADEPSNWGS